MARGVASDEPLLWCGVCQESKPRHLMIDRYDQGLYSWCRKCQHELSRENGESRTLGDRFPPRILDAMAPRLKRYGISRQDYVKMVREQRGLCAICEAEPTTVADLHIDHNHATREVRGLLCGSCNTSLGAFADDPERLRKAAEYLEERGNYAGFRVKSREELCRRCVLCNVPIPDGSKRWKYCSKYCQTQANREASRRRYTRRTSMEDPSSGRQVCVVTDCRAAAKRSVRREGPKSREAILSVCESHVDWAEKVQLWRQAS